jgi:glycosyltransferase involved in cell wall biosynthesis
MRLLALTESADFVCHRYRLEAYREELARHGWLLGPMALARDTVSFIGQLPRIASADVVVLQRRLLPWWKRRLLRRAAKVLVYDFDDALFFRDSNHRKPAESRVRGARFRATVAMADACLAGNRYLCEQADAYAQEGRVHYFPTCVDERGYPLAEHNHAPGEMELVWIGSRSTMASLKLAQPGMRAAADRLPGLALRVVCDAFPEIHGVRMRPVRWSRETEARELAAADAGVAWLPDHPWSLGKCGLKVLQYMAAGLPVVANPLGIHQELVVHGRTGFLAATPEQWAEALETLAKSPDLRRSMGSEARRRVAQHYSVTRWGPRLAEVIEKVPRTAPRP